MWLHTITRTYILLWDYIQMLWLAVCDHILFLIMSTDIWNFVMWSHKDDEVMLCDHIPVLYLSECDNIIFLIWSTQICIKQCYAITKGLPNHVMWSYTHILTFIMWSHNISDMVNPDMHETLLFDHLRITKYVTW